MTPSKWIAGLLLVLHVSPIQAGAGTEPKPMRREALTDGRDFSYNTEAFINRLSYRLPYWRPELRGDGVQGYGGSVKSNELYLDMFMQKTLTSDTGATELIWNAQRFEDFDGTADRLIVGVARYLTPNWKLAILGDIYGDKAESDIYFETHWTPNDNRFLRLGLIFPDAYYNSKQDDDEETRYEQKPQTWFMHYREGALDNIFGEIAVNYSPEAVFNDLVDGLNASGEQTQLMLATGAKLGEWKTLAKVSAEWADRDFIFARSPAPLADDFKRRSYEFLIESYAPNLPYKPRVGLRHFYLKEEGWFGDARDISGRLKRREPALYGGGSFEVLQDAYFEPMLYVSWADVNHSFDDPTEDRDAEKLLGKLTLNMTFILNKVSGAYLSISPSFYLHKGAFGGGCIRITWPF